MSNLAALQALYAAFAKGDIPTVLGLLSPDIRWTEAEGFPYGGTYVGRDAVLQDVFMRLGGEWDGYCAVPSELIDGGDTVVALGTYSGRYKATGRSFVAPFAHVWRFKNGVITQFEQHTDTLLVQRALADFEPG
jgi:ketosteroid isomerase-like protein